MTRCHCRTVSAKGAESSSANSENTTGVRQQVPGSQRIASGSRSTATQTIAQDSSVNANGESKIAASTARRTRSWYNELSHLTTDRGRCCRGVMMKHRECGTVCQVRQGHSQNMQARKRRLQNNTMWQKAPRQFLCKQ